MRTPLNPNHIDGVIFDLDGTLVDSTLDFALIRSEIGCPAEVDTLAYIDALPSADERRQAHQVVLRHEMADAANACWLPGAKALVDMFQQKGLPQAIVTRNCEQASRLKLSNNQIPIETLITREHFPPKPAPDALLAIAERWQIKPRRLAYVGDFKYDVLAGNNAGMISVLITNGKQPDYAELADSVFDTLRDLHACFLST